MRPTDGGAAPGSPDVWTWPMRRVEGPTCRAVRHCELPKPLFGVEQGSVDPEGYVGCAITCAPYLVLARHAAPNPARQLLDMSLSQLQQKYAS